MYGCTGVQVPPPFHTFYSHAVGCVGVDVPYPQNLCITILLPFSPILPTLGFSWICPNPTTYALPFPYFWKLWEPPGTYTTVGFSWVCPAPQYYGCHTGGYYWNHLEPCFELLRFSWMCPTPSTWNVWLHWCAGPPIPLFMEHFLFPCSRVCWHALPFSLQLDTIGTYWNHHEPPETIWKLHYPRTSWNLYDPTILLDVPYP